MKVSNLICTLCLGILFFSLPNTIFSQVGSTLPTGDFDGDGIINSTDIDDDNDGVLDNTEKGTSQTIKNGNLALNSGGSLVNGTSTSLFTDWTVVSSGALSGNVNSSGGVLNITQDGGTVTVSQNITFETLLSPQVFNITIFSAGTSPVTLKVKYNGVEYLSIVSSGGTGTSTPISFLNGTSASGASSFNVGSNFTLLFTLPNSIPKSGILQFEVTSSGVANDIRIDDISFTNFGDLDKDSDGIMNRFDLDSDGDGCSDAFEAGATGLLHPTDFQFTGPVGANGLNNTKETNDLSNAAINYTSTYTANALNNTIKNCTECDTDGIGDAADIDDDNDGITDIIENLGCNRTGEVAATATGFTSTMPDGVIATMTKAGPTLQGQAITIFNDNSKCLFSSSTYGTFAENNVDYVNIPVPFDASATSGFGYNLTFNKPVNEFYIFINNMDFGRIVFPSNVTLTFIAGNANFIVNNTTKIVQDVFPGDGASGTTCSTISNVSAGGVVRVSGTNLTSLFLGFVQGPMDADNIGFNFGSILCVADFDKDGKPNQCDTDSDNDGCYDAFEAGATTNPLILELPGPYGTNGLANNLENNDTPTATTTYTQTYDNAKNPNIKMCCTLDAATSTESCITTQATLTATFGAGNYTWSAAPTNPSIVTITSPLNATSTTTGVINTAGMYKFYLTSQVGGCKDSIIVNVLPFTNSLCLDSDNDGLLNQLDIDDDNDGILDATEGTGDFDNDGTPNAFDLDSDNDGCMDAQEAGLTTSNAYLYTFTGPVGANGYVNTLETIVDNGVPVTTPTYADANNGGLAACCSVVSAGANSDVCLNDTFTFMPTVLPGPITWTFEPSLSTSFVNASMINTTTANAKAFDFTKNFNTSFAVFKLNNRGCTSTVQLSLKGSGGKSFFVESGPINKCGSGGVTLTNDDAGRDSYEWFKDGILIATTTGNTYTATMSGSYTTRFINNGCGTKKSEPIVININPAPELTVSNSLISVCEGTTSLKIGVSSNFPVVWSPGGETTDSITIMPTGNNVYTVTSTAGVCSSVAIINVSTKKCVDTDMDGKLNEVDLDDDNDGILDFYEDLACPSTPTANTNSGSGNYKSNLYWFNWSSGAFSDGLQNGDAQTFTLSDGTVVTSTFSNVTGGGANLLTPTDMKTVFNATFADLYNTGGGQEALYTTPISTNTNFGFDVKFTATKAGNSIPISLVFADAELSSPGSELLSATTNGGVWKELQSIGTSVMTGSGTSMIAFTNTDFGTRAMYSENASVLRINNQNLNNGLGNQAVTFGLLLPCDKDNDGIPNSLDKDSDNDGCNDVAEAGHNQAAVANMLPEPTGANGLADIVETSPETGIINYTITKTGTTPLFLSNANLISGVVMGCGEKIYTMTAMPLGGTWSVVTTHGSTISSTGVYTAGINNTGADVTDQIIYSGVGCGDTLIFTIKSAPISTATNNGPKCIGTSLQLTATGGTSYAWSGPNGYTNATASPTIGTISTMSAGKYFVTVTNASGCTIIDSTIVVVNPLPIATATNGGNICAGDTIKLMATGGTTYAWAGPNSYAISTQNPQILNVTPTMSGAYTVTVTDMNLCSATKSTTVTVFPQESLNITGTNPVCNGASTGTYTVTISGGTGPFSYTENGGTAVTGQTSTFTVNGKAAGTYNVIVTDVNGCKATGMVTLTDPPAPTATATVTNPLCFGGQGSASLAFTQLATPVTYSYNGTASGTGNGTMIPNLNEGSYTVTVSGSLGCTATTSFMIVAPAAITATATNSNPLCNNGTGSIALTVSDGTITSYTYNSGGSNVNGTGNTISNLSSGTYNITVTNNNGCTATTMATITPPPALSITSSSSTNLTTVGGNEGSYTISAIMNGTAPYDYTDNRGGSGTDLPLPIIRSGLTPNTYAVTVTDANGCTTTTSFTIADVACNLSVIGLPTQPKCNGGLGGIKLKPTNNKGNISYVYTGTASGSGTTDSIANLAAGLYNIMVTDTAGCTANTVVTITNPAPITASGAAMNVTCNAGTDGKIALTTNGATPFTYAYDGSSTGIGSTNMITGLTAGTYNVTITDNNLCTAIVTSVVITEPAALVSNAGPDQSLCAVSTTLAATSPTLGTGMWSQVSGPSTSTFANSALPSSMVTVNAPGAYTYQWIVSMGTCTPDTDMVVIIYGTPTVGDAGPDQSMICGLTTTLSATGSGTWTVISGPAPLVVTPNNSATATATATVEGTYKLTYTILGNICPNKIDTVSIGLTKCDADNDGILNNIDVDDDNDGILDTQEFAGDTDGDGIIDALDRDSDNDGITDAQESYQKNTTYNDEDNNGILNGVGGANLPINPDGSLDGPAYTAPYLDSDGDNIPNHRDLDSDNDGIPDTAEANFGVGDSDNNGIAGSGTPTDTDKDGLLDVNDPDNGFVPTVIFNQDRDQDGVKNYLDIDIDNDGIVDNIEGQATFNYVAPTAADVNNNGWADVYEVTLGGSAIGYTNTDGGSAPDYSDTDADEADGGGIGDPFDIEENAYMPTGTEEDFETTGPLAGVLKAVNFTDTDGDGLADIFDDVNGFTTANNANNNQDPFDMPGASATSERNWRTAGDNDHDGVADIDDTDDDNDGIPDTDELVAGNHVDSDGDGSSDDQDVDADGDGIPDVIEAGGSDPDGDGLLGTTVLASATGVTVDLMGVPTGGPLVGPFIDTDVDGTVDYLDRDSDNDGITDAEESGGGDANGDGILGAGVGNDKDSDGLADAVDPIDNRTFTTDSGVKLPLTNSDGHGQPNYLDLDSDNDGITDVIEAGGADPDANGIIGMGASADILDADNDGLADMVDPRNNLLNAPSTGVKLPVTNSDTDTKQNYIDLDSDNDGIADIIEAQPTTPFVTPTLLDTDGDGVLDSFDVITGWAAAGITPVNSDGMDNPDYTDTNSDNDADSDNVESGNGPANGTDTDGDGIDNAFDNVVGIGTIANILNSETPTTFPNGDLPLSAQRDWREAGVDTDLDGVLDGLDHCPNTAMPTPTMAQGFIVAIGCTDADGDKFYPDTLAGIHFDPVDSNPCIPSSTAPGCICNDTGDGDLFCSNYATTDPLYDPAPTDPCIPNPNSTACDTDKDGVANGVDQCPNTVFPTPTMAMGFIAATGCTDADKDGYYPDIATTNIKFDPMDAMPCIPDSFVVVCDTDNDGVPNGRDACKTSAAGAVVNFFGCTDVDGDGYFPDLPIGHASYDSVDTEACIPQPSEDLCIPKDIDMDGYASNFPLGHRFYDPMDMQPCVPDSTVAACDLDMDGVADGPDLCEGSPSGSIVNSVGCEDADKDGYFPYDIVTTMGYDPMDMNPCMPDSTVAVCDTDKDGIANALDHCKFSALGATVNSFGCTDFDGDGFYPDTLVGSSFDPDDTKPCIPNNDFALCDDDNDGVSNNDDHCPNTPLGGKLLSYFNASIGCLDQDGDGYYPDTLAGSSFDPDDVHACIPDTSRAACDLIDKDGDGYYENVASTNTALFDPNDSNPCIPDNTVANCDTDNDGVADKDDDCPFSALGADVDNNGCTDNDSDGFYPDTLTTAAGYDPNDNDPCIPFGNDIDLDGYCDIEELILESNPIDPCSPDMNSPACDTDGDGVPNGSDTCPTLTAIGATVNTLGCTDADGDKHYPDAPLGSSLRDPDDANPCVPLPSALTCIGVDADGDGYFKNYPATHPFFDPNDMNPCIPSNTAGTCDTDKDGVVDANDQCPTTAIPKPTTGFNSSTGCTDADGDGYFPDAISGPTFDPNDADGCVPNAASPTCDTDGDGIADVNDSCPISAPGAVVNAAGCTDTDADGYFTDVALNSPSYDPDDTEKCIPDFSATGCVPVDADNDGFFTNVLSTHPKYDPNDANPCIPNNKSSVCDSDNDGVFANVDPDDINPCIPNSTGPNCDTDRDGVINSADLCPNTTLGSIVNDAGCKDFDKDGVAENDPTETDDNDACVPNANSGFCDADKDGFTKNNALETDDTDPCIPNAMSPLCDADNDGVFANTDPDDEDACNPNPAHPLCNDHDQDGVANASDICPTTPPGSIVDPLTGCRDRDNDGTPENTDPDDSNPCVPSTAFGICDSDLDGVPNSNDICPMTPVSSTVNSQGCRNRDGDDVAENIDPDDLDPCVPSNFGPSCDLDGDGIRNQFDQCNDTPTGVAVNGQGCSDADSDGVYSLQDPDDADRCVPNNHNATCDTDGDGINNTIDACPNSPVGAVVIANGCRDQDNDGVSELTDSDDNNPCIPVNTGANCDTDGDGVLNSADSCANTPFGSVVNGEGCRDFDGDGVSEKTDPNDNNKCIPNNTSATCDQDGDGVINANDICPNTPAGAVVNAQGCRDADNDGVAENTDPNEGNPCIPNPSAMACGDNDGDGILNAADICPNTPPVSVVNTQGCRDRDGDTVFENTDPNDADECIPNNTGPTCDTDHDGVVNANDDCPNTLAGNAVNTEGCPDMDGDGVPQGEDPNDNNKCIPVNTTPTCDTDGDGVINADDDCPLTPAGATVNAHGCRDADNDGVGEDTDPDDANPCLPNPSATACKDSDGDGILNAVDACPYIAGTAAGQGCPDADGDGVFGNTDPNDANACIPNRNASACNDNDGDGVLNVADLCPNTPAGATVNIQGCSDLDNDGVFGNIDPNDNDPCSPNSTGPLCDTDKDGVRNNLDQCPNTPRGKSVNSQGCHDGDGDGLFGAADSNDSNACIPVTTGPTCDADSDGVQNIADLCPGTPAGATVNAIGCRDADGDGYSNDLPSTSLFYDPADANACVPNPASPTCVVAALPDLVPNFTFGNTTYAVNDVRYIIVNINNAGTGASTGAEFFVPFSAGFTYEFDQTLSSALVNGTSEVVNNASWTPTMTGAGIKLNTSTPIPANGKLRAAFKITAIQRNTIANFTANITPGVGGEVNDTNNIAVLSQSIQN